MEDGETFRWPMVRAYHTVQQSEQGRTVTWNDEVTRLKLQRSLVWHRIAPSSTSPKPSATPTTNTPQATTRPPRHTGPFTVIAEPGNQACATYNQGLCSNNSAHPAELHVCSYYLQSAQRLCKHAEFYCKQRVLAKIGQGDVSSN